MARDLGGYIVIAVCFAVFLWLMMGRFDQ